MPTRSSFAPGKIILAGDHAAVYGYPALAIPSSIGMRATFEEKPSLESLIVDWSNMDDTWKSYIARIVAECGSYRGDVFRGELIIKNHIPLGRGMGSSTACVIAICRALLGEDCEDVAHKIEDLVNPGNSGLDFAVIWRYQPIRYVRGKSIDPVTLPANFLQNPTLIDTGKPNETTAELVAWVAQRKAELEEPLKIIGGCADRLLSGESPLKVFPDHHRAQIALGVLTKPAQDLIAAIEKSGGAAKVLGGGARTGGGGMVLAVHASKQVLLNDLHPFSGMIDDDIAHL